MYVGYYLEKEQSAEAEAGRVYRNCPQQQAGNTHPAAGVSNTDDSISQRQNNLRIADEAKHLR
jgi:hypothetical protein